MMPLLSITPNTVQSILLVTLLMITTFILLGTALYFTILSLKKGTSTRFAIISLVLLAVSSGAFAWTQMTNRFQLYFILGSTLTFFALLLLVIVLRSRSKRRKKGPRS